MATTSVNSSNGSFVPCNVEEGCMVTGCFEYTYVECVIQLREILLFAAVGTSSETEILAKANEEEYGGKNDLI